MTTLQPRTYEDYRELHRLREQGAKNLQRMKELYSEQSAVYAASLKAYNASASQFPPIWECTHCEERFLLLPDDYCYCPRCGKNKAVEVLARCGDEDYLDYLERILWD